MSMHRPSEYENLISKQFFRVEPALQGAAQTLLRNAEEHLTAVKILNSTGLLTPAFLTAYDGFVQVVQAVLEYREVRVAEEFQLTATQVVCKDLGMNVAEQCFVNVIHGRRVETLYCSPYPPVPLEDTQKLVRLLEKYIPVAYEVIGLPRSTK